MPAADGHQRGISAAESPRLGAAAGEKGLLRKYQQLQQQADRMQQEQAAEATPSAVHGLSLRVLLSVAAGANCNRAAATAPLFNAAA